MKNRMCERSRDEAIFSHNHPDTHIRCADLTDLVNRVYYARQFEEPGSSPDTARLEQILGSMAATDRRARLDLFSEFINVERYLQLIRSFGFRPELLRFRVRLDRYNRDDVLRMAEMFPGAIIECSTDTI